MTFWYILAGLAVLELLSIYWLEPKLRRRKYRRRVVRRSKGRR